MRATALIEGTVVHVGDRVTAGKKTKCVFVVECSSKPEFPNEVPVEAYGDEISIQAADLREGDKVTVECFVRGRAWQGKWYANISAHKIAFAPSQSARTETASTQPRQTEESDASDNLPF